VGGTRSDHLRLCSSSKGSSWGRSFAKAHFKESASDSRTSVLSRATTQNTVLKKRPTLSNSPHSDSNMQHVVAMLVHDSVSRQVSEQFMNDNNNNNIKTTLSNFL
jgi:hypothetical protein